MRKIINSVLIAICLIFCVGALSTGAFFATNFGLQKSTVLAETIGATETTPESCFTIDAYGTITKYNGTYVNVVVPETINGIEVKAIGERAFQYGRFETVTLPESCEVLYEYAFNDCDYLETVSMPGIVSIETCAFSDCGALAQFDIPRTCTYIAEGAFKYSEKIKEFSVEAGNEFFYTDGMALYSKEGVLIVYAGGESGRTTYTCKSEVEIDGESVVITRIGEHAVESIFIDYFVLPEKLEEIGDYVFSGCIGLYEISIPKTVSSIGRSIFHCCYVLEKIMVETGSSYFWADGRALYSVDGVLEAYALNSTDILGKGYYSAVEKIAAGEFVGEGEVVVTKVAYGAFNLSGHGGKNGVERVVLPESYTTIGEYAFNGCPKLKYFSAPGVTALEGGHNFSDSGITAIYDRNPTTGETEGVFLPKLATLGVDSFYSCDNLKTVELAETVTEISNSCFSSSAVESVYAPNVTVIGNVAFSGCGELKYIYSRDVEEIGTNAFYNCKSLPYLTTNVGGETQTQGAWLTGLKRVNATAFAGCTSLQWVYSDTISHLGRSAFSACEELLDVELLSEELNYVTGLTFENCVNLKYVNLPYLKETSSSPGYTGYIGMFINCSSITRISSTDATIITEKDGVWLPRLEKVRTSAFEGCTSLKKCDLNVTDVERSAFEGCVALSGVSLPNITKISPRSFKDCVSLKNFEIAYGVKSVSKITSYESGDPETYSDSFLGCSFDNLYFNATSCTTTEYAFGEFSVKNLHIGENVEKVATNMFKYATIENVFIESPSTVFEAGCIDLMNTDLNIYFDFDEEVDGTWLQDFVGLDFVANMDLLYSKNELIDDYYKYVNLIRHNLNAIPGYTAYKKGYTIETLVVDEYGNVGGGTISPSGVVQSETKSDKTFRISANEGYTLSKVEIDGVNVGTNATQVLTFKEEYQTLKATFVLNNYNISIDCGENGSFSNATGGTKIFDGVYRVARNDNFSVRINAGAGYQISSFLLNGVEQVAYVGRTDVELAIDRVVANHEIKVEFAIIRFTIAVSCGANGTVVSTDGNNQVEYGGSKTYVVTPNENYRIQVLKINGATWALSDAEKVGGYTYTFTNVTTNIKSIEAIFELNCFTITIDCGANGSFSNVTGGTQISSDVYQVFRNDDFSLKVNSDTGYKISTLVVDGRPQSASIGLQSYDVVISNIETNHIIKVAFAKIMLTISVNCGANGTIEPTDGSNQVEYGGNKTYSITPNIAKGYKIKSLSIGGSILTLSDSEMLNGCEYTFSNVTTNDNIISATFELRSYVITVNCGAHGTITPTKSTVVHGNSASFVITPNIENGYKIDEIKLDGVLVNISEGLKVRAYTYTISNVTSNKVVSATFILRTYTISASCGIGGAIESADGNDIVEHGKNKEYIITPNASAGYKISRIMVDGEEISLAEDDRLVEFKYTILNIEKNTTIYATFELKVYTIRVSCGIGGTASSVDGGDRVVHGGTKIYSINPNKNEGYKIETLFINGSEYYLEESKKLDAVVYTFENVDSDDYSLEVTFELRSYTISASSDGNGSITPTVATVKYGDKITFHITPNVDYRGFDFFQNEKKISTGSGESDVSITIKESSVFRVEFKLIPDQYYTVIHWQESLSITPNMVGGLYYSQTDTETLEGQILSQTQASAKTYSGFTNLAFSQTVIQSGGVTVVNIYYTRNLYEVSLIKAEGISSVVGEGEYKYGTIVQIGAEVENGYEWKEWTDGANIYYNRSYNFELLENREFTATTSLKKYSVTIATTLNGTIVQISNKNLNEVTLKDVLRFRATADVGYAVGQVFVDDNPVSNVSGVFEISGILKNTTIRATFVGASGVKYLVRHLKETLDGTGEVFGGLNYIEFSTLQLTGSTGDYTIAVAERFDGYSALSIEQKVVAGDGSTVVDVYYIRNKYSVTLNKDEGIQYMEINGVEYSAPQQFKFGTSVTISAILKVGNSWDKWTDGHNGYANISHVIEVPIGGIELTATTQRMNYKITVLCGLNGQINHDGSALSVGVENEISVGYGESVSLGIVPDYGYKLRQIILDGSPISTAVFNGVVNSGRYALSNISKNFNVNISFEKITYKIDVRVSGNGKAISGDVVMTDGTGQTLDVLFDENLSLTFEGEEGFKVGNVQISKDLVSEDKGALSEYTFEHVDSNYILIVVFEIKTYKIEFDIKGGGNLSCELQLDAVEHGDSRILNVAKKDYVYAYDIYVNGKRAHVVNDQVLIQDIKEDLVVKAIFKDARNFLGLSTNTWIVIGISTAFVVSMAILMGKATAKRKKKKRDGLLVENALNYEPEQGVGVSGGIEFNRQMDNKTENMNRIVNKGKAVLSQISTKTTNNVQKQPKFPQKPASATKRPMPPKHKK